MAIAKHTYTMDYIPDKDLFKAVMFATKMIRDGKQPSHAIRIASKYYQKDMSDIAHYVGQRGRK